jgi:hypothetical protein
MGINIPRYSASGLKKVLAELNSCTSFCASVSAEAGNDPDSYFKKISADYQKSLEELPDKKSADLFCLKKIRSLLKPLRPAPTSWELEIMESASSLEETQRWENTAAEVFPEFSWTYTDEKNRKTYDFRKKESVRAFLYETENIDLVEPVPPESIRLENQVNRLASQCLRKFFVFGLVFSLLGLASFVAFIVFRILYGHASASADQASELFQNLMSAFFLVFLVSGISGAVMIIRSRWLPYSAAKISACQYQKKAGNETLAQEKAQYEAAEKRADEICTDFMKKKAAQAAELAKENERIHAQHSAEIQREIDESEKQVPELKKAIQETCERIDRSYTILETVRQKSLVFLKAQMSSPLPEEYLNEADLENITGYLSSGEANSLFGALKAHEKEMKEKDLVDYQKKSIDRQEAMTAVAAEKIAVSAEAQMNAAAEMAASAQAQAASTDQTNRNILKCLRCSQKNDCHVSDPTFCFGPFLPR